MNKKEISEEIKSMKSMMESCYTYGGIGKESYNYERYILKYENILGSDLFNKVYDEHANYLKDFEIEISVYTDSEGLIYSSLKKK